MSIVKSLTKLHLDYGDKIYHDRLQDTMKLLNSIQYQVSLIIYIFDWQSTNAENYMRELVWKILMTDESIAGFVFTIKY